MEKIKFATYYDCTKLLNKLIEEGKVLKNSYTKYYICEDTHEYKVVRVLEGYNTDYEKVDGALLVEMNGIDKYNFVEYLQENFEDMECIIERRTDRDTFLDGVELIKGVNFILENVMLYDESEGYENYDSKNFDSYDNVIDFVDSGYGIIELEI